MRSARLLALWVSDNEAGRLRAAEGWSGAGPQGLGDDVPFANEVGRQHRRRRIGRRRRPRRDMTSGDQHVVAAETVVQTAAELIEPP